jgi:predicted nucleotide-binding protein
MAKINGDLLRKLQNKLGVSQAQVYKLVAKKVGETGLPRNVAAVRLAAELGINVSKRAYASDDERAMLRGLGSPAAKAAGAANPIELPAGFTLAPTSRSRTKGGPRPQVTPARKSNNVMVVHGRNMEVRDSMFAFLRALKLNPLEFSHGVKATKKGAPGTLEVVDAMFKAAAAVVVVLTPDDEARLKTKFRKASDPSYEKNLTGQPRPNVLFEAGRAFGSHPDVTILVQVGPIRPFSDAAGLHIVHLGDGAAGLSELATRLETAGCAVDRTGQDWLKVKFDA